MLLALAGCATAEQHYYAGRFDQAVAAAQGAEKAKLLALKAFVSGGDYAEAIGVAEAAQAEALTWEGFARYAQAMTGGSDDYGDAADCLDRALSLRRKGSDRRGLAEAMFYRGLVAERQGDRVAALSLYGQALDIAEHGGFALEESYAQRHIGLLERNRERLQRSLDLRQRIGFRVFLPFSILSLAEIDTSLGRFDEAEKEFVRARKLGRRLGFRRVEVLVDLSWSELREKQQRPDQARQLLRRALKTSQEIGYARGVQIATSRLGGGVPR